MTNPDKPKNWQGQVLLTYRQNDQRTAIAAWAQAPLKVQRPFYPEGPEVCHTVVIHTAGGMVAGDQLNYDIKLSPGTRAVITTAAAAKVYRSQQAACIQALKIHVGAAACLEWLPQETILFAEAQFRQRLQVQLEPGAHWLGWDIYRFGRTAGQETFLGGDWRSQAEVWQGDTLLWGDRQWLPGTTDCLTHGHGLNGQPVAGTLVWLGSSVTAEQVQVLRSLGSGAGEIGVSQLPLGVICRYRGPSTAAARSWFTAVWNDLRQHRFQQSACLPRVWQQS